MGPASNARPFPATVSRLRAAASVPAAGARALAAGMTQRDAEASKRRVLNGMFSVLVDPAALADRAGFEQEALAFLDWVKASPPREGFAPVSSPGEPERASRARHGD